jgi:hypothetical protein
MVIDTAPCGKHRGRTAFHAVAGQKVLRLITEVFVARRPVNALFTMLAEVLTHAAFGR